MKNLQVLLLAGGVGKRMWPLRTCKSLIKFLGKPIIRYIYEDLIKAGVEDFKVVCAKEYYLQIKSIFSQETAKIKFFVQKEPLGMADAILSVDRWEAKPLVIVSPEDLLDSKAYKGFFIQCRKTKADLLLAGIYQKDYFAGGYFILDGKRIKGIVEKPPKGKQPSNFVNLVLHYFKNPQVFIKFLQKVSSEKDDVYEVALDKMIKDGVKTELFAYKGYWISLKHPWHILQMMETIFKFRMESRIKNTQISPKVTIKGKVIIEQGVKIKEGACITGPAYIGKNSIIGNNVLVRESMIGKDCVIGFSTEIARSWIGDNCWFHTNYIGDSVLAENISFGSGAVTANLRLDEGEIFVKKDEEKINTGRNKLGSIIGKGVRIGVNTSLMPGVFLGRNSFVDAGIVLNQNLPEESFALQKGELVIKGNLKKVTPRCATKTHPV